MDTRTCAFCGMELQLDRVGSLSIVVGSDRDPARQELFAHTECIAKRLHPQTPFEATVFERRDSD